MKKNLFSILLVVVMTLAMVACGTQETTNDVPVSTETIEATVESDENSEAVSETEQATEAPVDEVVKTVDETVESESSEATSETESDEVASTPDSEAVESEASEPETSEPEFTVTELTATKYATQSVNVRSGPSTDYDKIGGLTTNQEVQVTGQASTGWYRFIWTDGREAYVSDKYLSDSKVEKPAASETPSNGGGSTAGTGSASASGKKNWQDYYTDHVWYDGGEYMFIIVDSLHEGQSVQDYSSAQSALETKFPGEKVYLRAGAELRDGHWMFFAYVRPESNNMTAFVNQFE